MILDAAAERIVLFWGVRRSGAAALAGAASALAMAPFDLWPILALTFPVAVWRLDGSVAAGPGWRSYRAAAAVGWWFGFGYFLAGLWWIGSAFLVQADVFGWMMPFAVLAMPAGLALFTALGFALAWALWVPGPARVLAFALGLGGAEFLRGTVLTGFPWNAFGYALADQPWLGQAASVIGVEGLTFVALAVFAAPATLAASPVRRLAPTLLAGATLLALAAFGGTRLAGADTALREEVRIRIVQPRIPQDAKFRPSAGPEILATYLALSDTATAPDRSGLADATLLVWPESAFPFFLARTPQALAAIGAALPEGTRLVTGAARPEEDADGRLRVFNAIQIVGHDGTIQASYDKVHLVPFGEYLPLQPWLEAIGLEQLTRLRGGFAAGAGRADLELGDGLRLRPLICYEAIFPTESAGEQRPDALLNVTNDGWFGDTPGPRQHLAMARVRAIEQGLPLVRAANTGISAIIDGYGRSLRSLSLGQRGVVDGTLPTALAPTFYARFGRLATFAVVVFLCLTYLALRKKV